MARPTLTLLQIALGVGLCGIVFGAISSVVRVRRSNATGHAHLVLSVAFSKDGHQLLSGDVYGIEKLWDVDKANLLESYNHFGNIWCTQFQMDGRATYLDDVWLRTTATGHLGYALMWPTSQAKFLAISPGGHTAVSIGCTTILWNFKSGQPTMTLETLGHSKCIAYTDRGDQVPSIGCQEEPPDLERAQRRATQTSIPAKWRQSRHSVAFSGDGSMLSVATGEHCATLFDATTLNQLHRLDADGTRFVCVAFSPDGEILTSGGTDGTVKLWNTKTYEQVATLKADRTPILCLDFSPDGSLIASGSSDGSVNLWDLRTGSKAKSLLGAGPVLSIAFSPDGKMIACGGSGVQLWEVAKARRIAVLSEVKYSEPSVRWGLYLASALVWAIVWGAVRVANRK